MILDSNLVIYTARPEHTPLRQALTRSRPVVSAITLVEVLGYHRMTPEQRLYYGSFFAGAVVLPVTEDVIFRAAKLRAAHKMSLGDAVIAATALVFGHGLLTHNPRDFANIPGLAVSDPLAQADPAA